MRLKQFNQLVQDSIKNKPKLDPDFLPGSVWNLKYRELAEKADNRIYLKITVENELGNTLSRKLKMLSHIGENKELNIRYTERILKTMLWLKGGANVLISGNREIFTELEKIYSDEGERAFDNNTIGRTINGSSIKFYYLENIAPPKSYAGLMKIGGHQEGCRLGIDIGGTNKKFSIVKDGVEVHSEAIPWAPHGKSDPKWYKKEFEELIDIALTKVDKIDAIGVSSAGVFIANRIKEASIFSGVPKEKKEELSNIFLDIKKERGINIVAVNDGEVATLAGSLALNINSLLCMAVGTGLGGGYINESGNITDMLNEIGHIPFDYRADGVVSGYSGDVGIAEDYISIKRFPYLAKQAGIDAEGLSMADTTRKCNTLAAEGDSKGVDTYKTLGAYIAYAIVGYHEYYQFDNLIFLGGVTMGKAGEILKDETVRILKEDYNDIYKNLKFVEMTGENKHCAMAFAASTLPE